MDWVDSYIVLMRWPVPHFHIAVAAGLILWPAAVAPGFAEPASAGYRVIPVQTDAPPENAQPENAPPEDDSPQDAPDDQAPPDEALTEPAAPPEPTAEARLREREDLDALFAELAEPEGEAWSRAETDILRIWSRSGSASMDMLLKRGEAALDAGDTGSAIGHLTALTDHAPDFAGGWYLRGVAFYLQGDYGVAIADMAETLKLEPRHFGALTQLGAMFEELGDNDRALDAYRASLKIHPHQQDAADAVTRLEAQSEGTDA